MSIQNVNQHLRVYVSPAAATEPTVPADGNTLDLTIVTAGTGLPLGGITFRTNVGLTTVRDDATLDPTADTMIIYKDLAGIVHTHTIAAADVLSSDLQRAAVAPTEQVSNLTIAATPTVGDSYVARLIVPGYGGLLGAQNEVYFYGTYTVKTGDDADAVAAALGASLKTACDNAPVAFASVTISTATITVTGIAQPYSQARWSGRQVNFALSLSSPDDLVAGDDGDTTSPDPGNGNYNQVASMEEFYAGENRGYANRYSDWPAMTEPTLAAASGQVYTSDTVVVKAKYGAANAGTQRQEIVLFYQE